MTYVQYPYEVLSELGQNLHDIGDRLSSRQRAASDVQGLGGGGQSRVHSAIDDFRHTWKTSVGDLTAEIGHWGGLSKAIGAMVSQFDIQASAELRPSQP